MDTSLLKSLISSDPTTKGFDLSAGTKWIYPMNYPFRDYQYNITKTALYDNTLVCLPTGLGKTFIAAVVMYNFWRWYPQGKIIFLAPTKPLVAQQIDACHNIMGIPCSETIELTGSMNPKNRKVSWFTKRVIFATPQILQNDLDKNIAPGELIKCVVVDEAHKALGKHAYCESLRLLKMQNNYYRVLALSATPGSKIEHVQQIIENLYISKLELRDEASPDIIPYIHKRQMDIVLVPLDENLSKFKEMFVSIMNIYLRRLVQFKILSGDISTISKGRIFYLLQDFKTKPNRSANYGQIMQTLNRCISLTHAFELLVRHGIRAFHAFCQNHSSDPWMTDNPQLKNLVYEIETYLGPFPDVEPSPDGIIPEISQDLIFGHTKFYKLKQLLLQHFQEFESKQECTRVIVFVEYRESVNEVYVCLLQLRPTVRPEMFVGQSGQKKKQQTKAMEAFRNNKANVLISTSVGEEGLDVGEVDLIICFDVTQRSPIRLVQRMGRTGRRRDGRIIMLVTDGKEHQALKSTIFKRDSLNNKVLHSSRIVSALYQDSPRMVPPTIMPECHKLHIEVRPMSAKSRSNNKNASENILDKDKKKNKKTSGGKGSKQVAQWDGEKSKSTQSSMLKFLKKPSTDENSDKILTCKTQAESATQVANPATIKLLTSDDAAIEFLTLCAIRASRLEDVHNEMARMDTGDLTETTLDPSDNFTYYPLPDLSVLNCIASLEPCKDSAFSETTQLDGFDEIDEISFLPAPENHGFSQNFTSGDLLDLGESRFEDLLNDTFDSDETMFSEHEENTESNIDLGTCHGNKVEGPQKNVMESDVAIANDDCEEEDFSVPGLFEHCISDSETDSLRETDGQTENVVEGLFESILSESSDDETVNAVETIQTSSTNSVQTHLLDHKNEKKFKAADTKSLIETETPDKAPTVSKTTSTSKAQNSTEVSDACRSNLRSSFFKPRDISLKQSTDTIANRSSALSQNHKTPTKFVKKLPDEDDDVTVIDDEDDLTIIDAKNTTINDTNTCTVTQIINLVEKEKPKKIQFNNLKRNKMNLSSLNKSKITPEKVTSSTSPGKLVKDQCANNNSLTSRFFSNEKTSKETLRSDEIDWEDDFPIDICADEFEKPGDDEKFVQKTLGEIFSQVPVPHANTGSKSTNFVQEKSPVRLVEEFNFQDYEWDSDFETPDNPVASLRHFAKSDQKPKILAKTETKTKSPRSLSFENSKLPSRTNQQLLKSTSPSKKKLLSIRKNDIRIPSTSKKTFFEDNDFEDDWFETESEFDQQKKGGDPTTNYALVSARSSMETDYSKLATNNKENQEPKSNIMDLSVFAARNKMKLPSSLSTGMPKAKKLEQQYRRELERKKKMLKKKSKNRRGLEFLNREAEISSDTSSGTSGDDDDLDDLVSYTQEIPESVDMRAHYLQSIKDVHRPGAFYIKNVQNRIPDHEVFSQLASRNESSMYEYDSFCVSGGDEEVSQNSSISEPHEITIYNDKKRQRTKSKYNKSTKRRKLMQQNSESSSSEDETEKLREQIHEESLMIKKSKN